MARYRPLAFEDNIHGEKARKFLNTIPILTDYEMRFYRSFWDIGTERSFGMAPGPIPRSAITRYADDEGITDPTDILILKRVIRNLDNAYLNALAAKRKRDETAK